MLLGILHRLTVLRLFRSANFLIWSATSFTGTLWSSMFLFSSEFSRNDFLHRSSLSHKRVHFFHKFIFLIWRVDEIYNCLDILVNFFGFKQDLLPPQTELVKFKQTYFIILYSHLKHVLSMSPLSGILYRLISIPTSLSCPQFEHFTSVNISNFFISLSANQHKRS